MQRSDDNSEALATLVAQTDWAILTKRLLLFAAHHLGRYDRPASQAHDYVVRAVEELLENPPRLTSDEQSLFSHLATTVGTLIEGDKKVPRRKTR